MATENVQHAKQKGDELMQKTVCSERAMWQMKQAVECLPNHREYFVSLWTWGTHGDSHAHTHTRTDN